MLRIVWRIVCTALTLASSLHHCALATTFHAPLNAGTPNSLCNTSSQRSTLLLFYGRTGGPTWTNSSLWPTRPVRETALLPVTSGLCFSSAGLLLPDHCCYYGVECCSSTACPVLAPYTVTNCDCTIGLVTAMRFNRNNLTGPLFAWQIQNYTGVQMLQALACSLRKLDLRHNSLTGQLPAATTMLSELRILDLAYNTLTGGFPPNMQQMTELRMLDLTLNKLNGTVPKDLCSDQYDNLLSQLILSGNPLGGSLDVFSCNNLIVLNVNDCNFSSIADRNPLVVLPDLHLVYFSNNDLHNRLFEHLSQIAPFVDTLILTGNRLTGTLPASLALMPNLNALVMADNRLSGVLDPMVFLQLDALSHLDLSNNRLRGPLPETIGAGKQLKYLDLSGNLLTGSLPQSFSKASFQQMYLKLTGNAMSCCGVNFTLHSLNPLNWSYAHYDLSLPRLPPGLKFSDNCWTATASGLCCPFVEGDQPASSSDYYGSTMSYLNWYLDSEYSLYENCTCPEGLNVVTSQSPSGRFFAECQSPPGSSTAWFKQWFWIWIIIGLVLTVLLVGLHWWVVIASGSRPMLLQSFLDMRKRLKGAPRSGIVSVVVTDIEGFTNLVKRHPESMMHALQLHNQIIRVAMWNNFGHTVEQEGDSYSIVFYEALDAVKFCLQAQQLLEKQLWPPDLVSGSSLGKKRARTGRGSAFLGDLARTWQRTSRLRKRSVSGPSAAAPVPSSTPVSSPTPSHSPGPGSFVAPPSPRHQLLAPKDVKANAFSQSFTEQPAPLDMGALHPVNGLRVRMGVFSGQLLGCFGVVGSQVMEMAKVVSDAACGGQVLMCGATFQAVSGLGKELGHIGAYGTKRPLMFNYLSPFTKPRQHQDRSDATLLDMGQYLYCEGDAQLPLTLTPHFTGEPGSVSQDQMAAGGAAAAPREKQGSVLRLYQVLAPSLVARGRWFGSKLSLKGEWKQLERDYYSAPGVLAQPSGRVRGVEPALAPPPPVLPLVTMVFCTVDGGKQYAQRIRSRDLKDVHLELLAVIRSVLLQVPGGYLLRHHLGDVKFMLAFDKPQSALVWCMAVSECAMYSNWPQSALRNWPEENSADGSLLFRGPRLKMGVCQGRPGSILPDYLGKADYLGDSVNQAARFMDAAAHGGQVVCEQALVESLLGPRAAPDPDPPLGHPGPSPTGGAAAPLGGKAPTREAGLDSRPSASDISSSTADPPEERTSSSEPSGQAPALARQLTPALQFSPHSAGCLCPPSASHPAGCLGGGAAAPWRAAATAAGTARLKEPHPCAGDHLPTLEEHRDLAGGGGGSGSGPRGAAACDGGDDDGVPQPPAPAPVVSPPSLRQPCDSGPPSAVWSQDTLEVVALRLGLFRFKGVPGLTSMVHICHRSLAGRRYPAEAPSGKGERVEQQGGELLSGSVPLLRVVEAYRAAYRERLLSASHDARSATAGSVLYAAPANGYGRLTSILSMVRLGKVPSDREPGAGMSPRWRNKGSSSAAAAAATAAAAGSSSGREMSLPREAPPPPQQRRSLVPTPSSRMSSTAGAGAAAWRSAASSSTRETAATPLRERVAITVSELTPTGRSDRLSGHTERV